MFGQYLVKSLLHSCQLSHQSNSSIVIQLFVVKKLRAHLHLLGLSAEQDWHLEGG